MVTGFNSFSNYGNTTQTTDFNMFRTKTHGFWTWSGRGTVDNSPDTNLYLRRPYEDRAQGLYIPEGTYGGFVTNGFCFDNTNNAVVHFFGTSADEFYRDIGGNVTVSATPLVLGTNLTLTFTANTTVQAIEAVVSDSDSEQEIYVYCESQAYFINDVYKQHLQNMPSAATAALTEVEGSVV